MAITFVSRSGPATGTTTITALNFPTGGLIGDLFLLWITYKGAASNTATIPGWGNKVLSATGGGMFLDLYTRRVVGGESGTVGTITATGSTDMMASVSCERSGTGELVVGASSFGADTVSDTTYSAATAAMATTAGGIVVYCNGWAANIAAPTARTITQTGGVFGALTAQYGSAGTAQRQEVGDAPVTTGATNPVTWAATLAVATTGITGIVSLTQAANGINKTDGHTLQWHMNRKAGTIVNGVPTHDAQGAANIWAGTTNMDLVGALNVRAGNTRPNWRALAGVLNQLAGTTNLEVDGAAASIP